MNPTPSNKTVATVAATALVTIAVWALSLAKVEVPAEVAAAGATIAAILIAYFVPATSGKYVTGDPEIYVHPEGEEVGDFEDIDENPDALTMEDDQTPVPSDYEPRH